MSNSDGHDHSHGHGHDHDHGHGHGHSHTEAKPPREVEVLAAGAGAGKLLFVDAFSGVAGDMLLAALLDLGVPLAAVEDGLAGFEVRGYRIEVRGLSRAGIVARKLDVVLDEPQPARDYGTICDLINASTSLTAGARTLALRAFEVLARAEAEVHQMPLSQVHFHEVGAVDSIVDIVGCAIGLDYLGATLNCSPLPMGHGTIRSQHGMIPSPAPATVLCLRGVPTYAAGIAAELVTPTGACLMKAAASDFCHWPSARPERVGWGAGTRELSDRPNLLRLVLASPSHPTLHRREDEHVVIETNVDDMSGELAAVALAQAQQAGALDAWSTPIGMKKGRPALLLSALCPRDKVEPVSRALFSETTSLGLRLRTVTRLERPRRLVEVDTPYGPIPVKVAGGDGMPENAAPEYEACRRAAQNHGVPTRQVYAEAMAAYVRTST